MNDETVIKIKTSIWHRNHKILIEARENCTELLNEHISSNGIETKKHACIAEMYEKEIREINSLLEYSSNNSGVPF